MVFHIYVWLLEGTPIYEANSSDNCLVMTNIAIENGHRNSEFSISSMVIVHSYVKLPEGNCLEPGLNESTVYWRDNLMFDTVRQHITLRSFGFIIQEFTWIQRRH